MVSEGEAGGVAELGKGGCKDRHAIGVTWLGVELSCANEDALPLSLIDWEGAEAKYSDFVVFSFSKCNAQGNSDFF